MNERNIIWRVILKIPSIKITILVVFVVFIVLVSTRIVDLDTPTYNEIIESSELIKSVVAINSKSMECSGDSFISDDEWKFITQAISLSTSPWNKEKKIYDPTVELSITTDGNSSAHITLFFEISAGQVEIALRTGRKTITFTSEQADDLWQVFCN